MTEAWYCWSTRHNWPLKIEKKEREREKEIKRGTVRQREKRD